MVETIALFLVVTARITGTPFLNDGVFSLFVFGSLQLYGSLGRIFLPVLHPSKFTDIGG